MADKYPLTTLKFSGNVTNETNFMNDLDEGQVAQGIAIVVDVTNVTYGDSSFLGRLISFHKASIENGYKFFILNERNDNFMTDIFKTTSLNKVLKIIKNENEIGD